MTILAVQCRLSSKRLPQKALLDLDGKPIIAWVFAAMKKVKADRYFLAADEDSAEKLFPVARAGGFECFAGPKDDVLERFCLLIKATDADTVIRVTGDNPFLLYESVAALEKEFNAADGDYFTWTGLPHGSGAEIFSGKSLLAAAAATDDPFDREHAGPAIYRHPERFRAVKKAAPPEWNYPQYRTTVDTKADYERARRLVRAVGKRRASFSQPAGEPFNAGEIIEAAALVQHPVLFVPSVKKGRGTGHLRRCVALADELCADILIPPDADLPDFEKLLQPLADFQIKNAYPEKGWYGLIAADCFALEKNAAVALAAAAPLAAIDDGSAFGACCEYLLDIIPGCLYKRKPNLFKSSFITQPKNRREFPKKIEKALVVIGGEDPAGLTLLFASVLNTLGLAVTAVTAESGHAENFSGIRFIKPVENLMEKLAAYDLIVTHYGFTAFEALAAGCAVLLAGTSPLHIKLSKYAGFTVLAPENCTVNEVRRLVKKSSRLLPRSRILDAVRTDKAKLSDFILKLAAGRRGSCPVCGNTCETETRQIDPVVSRCLYKTYRRCRKCGLLYLSWSIDGEKQYEPAYFFDEYKNQYGKTYLEDFESIKAQGIRRSAIMDELFWRKNARRVARDTQPAVLDVGCAYGPFLSAANDCGWKVYGTDIAADAVDYVRQRLAFPAVSAAFPDFDAEKEFGVKTFDALTMWFVIEHFRDLDSVLRAVSRLLKTGGIFAFSTPSASGLSARFRRSKFFLNSPADHFSLWQPEKTAAMLAKYGFKVKKIVSTGLHPERFPFILKNRLKAGSPPYRFLASLCRVFGWGDTFETYCVKTSEPAESKNDRHVSVL